MQTTGWAFEEVAPGANTFAAFGFDPAEVPVADTATIVGIPDDRSGRRELDHLIAQSRVAIFHNVSLKIAGALAAAPPSVLRVWSGWGGDYYGTAYNSYADQLEPATAKVVHGAVRPTFWAGRALHSLRVTPVLRAAARAADVFSAPVPEDLVAFRRRFPGFTGVYSQLNYVTVEDAIATGPRPELGSSILLGNSASPTNNHIDILQLISAVDLGARRVIAPLSYGDQGYAAAVVEAGAELLGDNFVPVTGFLPLDKYNELLAECGTVIMGHRRQEGVGNVLRALWQGARLVMDMRSPVLEHLRSRGVEVSAVDEIPVKELPVVALTSEQERARQSYLQDNWSRQAVKRNVEALLAFTP